MAKSKITGEPKRIEDFSEKDILESDIGDYLTIRIGKENKEVIYGGEDFSNNFIFYLWSPDSEHFIRTFKVHKSKINYLNEVNDAEKGEIKKSVYIHPSRINFDKYSPKSNKIKEGHFMLAGLWENLPAKNLEKKLKKIELSSKMNQANLDYFISEYNRSGVIKRMYEEEFKDEIVSRFLNDFYFLKGE